MDLGTHKGKEAPFGNEAESQHYFSQDLAAHNSWEENHHVLALSLIKLHSAQEAIETEVHKLKDVGKKDPLFLDNSIQPSEAFQSGETNSNTIQTLKHNVVHEGDLKTELEEILKQRIQVEVQYIAISSQAIQHSNYVHQMNQLMVQQKRLALQHIEVMKKLECAENKARDLKTEAEKLKVTCQEILEREQVLELQNRACRLTCCFTVQVILFVLVVYLFSSHHSWELVLVPT